MSSSSKNLSVSVGVPFVTSLVYSVALIDISSVHCRELQQSIAREPSAPSFNVPAYQSTPGSPNPAPAAGPTPAPRTVFVSIKSDPLSRLGFPHSPQSNRSLVSFQTQQPPAKATPPARPPPPSITPQAASSSAPASATPAAPASSNPPPVAPAASQAQGPPYPTYQGYPGYNTQPLLK